ncbi:sodium:solute symporter family transporter [Aquisphaera insulae]|uniref:sodium:solute symporter family transporter n=1 Tax=Aquisphaera insulae TaxID=2712864 RepID=UPI00202ED897|nr:sodium:solute symporter [Aquisphaera insulae]
MTEASTFPIAAISGLTLGMVDWLVVALYSAAMIGLGWFFSRTATRSTDGFLIGERSLPWWVIGFANVASYSDSGGGWVWLFYVGGFMYLNQIAWIAWPIWMPLVGVFWAKMWRRSGVVTTGELIELRYSGRGAAAFRGFYGVYACLAWATVFLGYGTAILAQLLAPLIGWSPTTIVVVFGTVTLSYTVLGGLLGAAYIDLLQFGIFFCAALVLWYLGVEEQGGYAPMLARATASRGLDFWQIYPPSSGANTYVDPASLAMLMVLGLFLAGSPCAGEGWTAQRCLAARDERHAVLGQMLNSILSLVIRMIPLLPLGILAIATYPAADPGAHAMLRFPDGTTAPSTGVWSHLVIRHAGKLPGFGGLIIAAVLAGYMATVGTMLQWGSSFVVNDLYRRHFRPTAAKNEHILVARLVMVAMMVLASFLAFSIRDIGAWVFYINAAMITPALPLAWLRWFWWRLNVWGEIFGILLSVPLSAFIWFGLGWRERPVWQPTLLLLMMGFVGSTLVSLATPAESRETLRRFYLRIRPHGFWGPVRDGLEADGLADSGRRRRELRWDLLAAGCGIAFCFTITWSFFTAVMLRWAEFVGWAAAASVAGFAYYTFWMRSHALAVAPDADTRKATADPAIVEPRGAPS